MNPEVYLTKERKALSDWLGEWTLDQALGEEEATHSAVASPTPPADLGGEAPPVAGQIRLWPGGDARDPPCYGLLLPSGYGEWWVLPFSRFAHPASPDEWRLRDDPPARVLQGWNRRRIATARAAASWPAGQVPGDGLFLPHAFLHGLESGGAPPPALRAGLGPPLRHPLDPRHEYRDLEWERVGRALGEVHAVRRETEALPWAAERPEAFGRAVWNVPGESIRLVADGHEVWIEPDSAAWTGALLEADGLAIPLGPGKTACEGAKQIDWRRLRRDGQSRTLSRLC